MASLQVVVSFLYSVSYATAAGTGLQQFCDNEPYSYYFKGSCFVGSSTQMTHAVANDICTSYPNGHLAFLTTQSRVDVFAENYNSGNIPIVTRYWTGVFQVNTTDEPAGGWGYIAPSGKVYIPPSPDMIPWRTNQPSNEPGPVASCAAVYTTGIYDTDCDRNFLPLCQYNERKANFRMLASGTKGHAAMVITNEIVDFKTTCAKKCKAHLICGSFSFNRNGTCLTHWFDGQTPGYGPVAATGYQFFVIE